MLRPFLNFTTLRFTIALVALISGLILCGCAILLEEPTASIYPSFNVLPPDEAGDLDLDSQRNTDADQALFIQYLLRGRSVFTIDSIQQMAAGDLDGDGIPLELEDFGHMGLVRNSQDTMLARYCSERRFRHFDVDTLVHQGENYRTKGNSNGTLLIIFNEIGSINLIPEADLYLDMAVAVIGNRTRVLIYPDTSGDIYGSLFATTMTPVSAEQVDPCGEKVDLTIGGPRQFALYQNEPNPFQGETHIPFDLPSGQRDFTLEIRDSEGRIVYSFSSPSNSRGRIWIDWNSGDLPPGQYFATLTAGENFASITMLVGQ